MADRSELFRSLDGTEIDALGPMPDADDVSPTTDRDSRTVEFTAEVHYAGTLESAAAELSADDRFPPPRSLTEED